MRSYASGQNKNDENISALRFSYFADFQELWNKKPAVPLSMSRSNKPHQGYSMIDYQSTLLGLTDVAEGTMAFQFEKPNDFQFKAGQSVHLTLTSSETGSLNRITHTLSIASSPYDEELVVTTRMRDTAFKQAISMLPIGSPVIIEGPTGSF